MKLTQPRIIQHWQKEFSHSSYSNYFTPVHQDVYAQKSAKSLVFLLPKDGFSSLYFISDDLCDLDEILQTLPPESICLEIIQKGQMPPELSNIIQKYFYQKAIYEKITLATHKLKLKTKLAKLQNILYPTEDDMEFLYQSLYQNFDKRFDHFPDKKMLLSYIQNQQILIKNSHNQIAAYLIYTLKEKTSHFNFLANLGTDSFSLIELIEQYYTKMLHSHITHIFLWVDKIKNPRVKNMHFKYGYQTSNIFNYAFIKK
ncbi:hypothetical protein [Helicobacter sp. 11S03491-1]|uniref:hypothetical protein n=1 Tax=Helicobacter sp. 11S03491-1 TaxID=1476196 RepID=UPI000BA67AF3|nr:hypothetical protein [Helicobacter sp. 11S03491-1]PAF43781.1 hypothetical protein BKH45_00500 [Helicobacter sp. 11S03491-1]